MSTRLLLLLILVAATSTFAQEPGLALANAELKGRVQSAGWERVYVRMNGRNIGESRVKLNLFRYDDRGRITEAYTYGNGHRKTTYRYSGEDGTAVVSYYDTTGNEVADPSKFRTNFEDEDETGLCSNYSVRREIDKQGGIRREYETCTDGSLRASTVSEDGADGELRRMIRTDAKSRSWESVCDYDKEGNLTEFRFTVRRPTATPYTHTVRYADHRYDDHGNLVRMTATGFLSTKPGELLFQFNEVQNISYYEPQTSVTPGSKP